MDWKKRIKFGKRKYGFEKQNMDWKKIIKLRKREYGLEKENNRKYTFKQENNKMVKDVP